MQVNYKDLSIVPITYTVPYAAFGLALNITQKQDFEVDSLSNEKKILKFILKAEHTSVLEHNSITILARGISRSLLAQITRERHFSFTSGSQHYQNYQNYPFVTEYKSKFLNKSIEQSIEAYSKLIESGVSKEEARQVLPNAMTVNLLITANARALIHFLRTRLCKRNVKEMQIFAQRLSGVCKVWWPKLFNQVGPPCIMDGKCNQGKMSCGEPYETI